MRRGAQSATSVVTRNVNTNSSPTRGALRQAQCKPKLIMWYVYMIICDKKTFYIGMTNDLIRRRMFHESKKSFFTKKFSELKLVYCEQYISKKKAALRERQLKGWSRAKKQKLIARKLGKNNCTGFAEALWGGREVYPE